MACLDEPTVLAFVAGRATSDEVDEHLASCRACRDLVVLAARTTFASGSQPRPHGASAAEPAATDDRYTITGLVGAGGQALVYTAQDNVLGRTVALKILRDARDPKVLEEARFAARLNHPNIVAIHDAGAMRDGQLYLAMEYVAAGSLDGWIRKQRRSHTEILRACIDAGRGLTAAHGAGIVHRDIKAANILVDDDGRGRISDFGLATAAGTSARVAGTLAYMAPEQLDGHATAASDQFSFAVTVWEALTGTLPFALAGDRAAAVLAGIVPPKRALPRSLDRALRRALDADPQQRWKGMSGLVAALGADPYRVQKRIGIAAVFAAAIGTTAVVVSRPEAAACVERGTPMESPAVRARIAAAFAASRKPFAPAMLRGVVDQLDVYAARLAAARTDACRATAEGTQTTSAADLRDECLDDAALALRATLDTLATADDAVIEHALDLLRGLPAISPCSDTAWLRERVKPPATVAARAQVSAIAAQLGTTQALLYAGKLADARTTAAAAAAQAKQLDHAPTRARAELELGKAIARMGDTQEAEHHLQDAAQLAQRGRDDRAAAEAWIELVKVVGHGNGRYDEALRYAGFAEATAARLGDDKALIATLDHYRCAILDLQAKLDAAKTACANAVRLRSGLFGPESLEVADVLIVQARVVHKLAKDDEARSLVTRAVAIREKLLGKDHPAVMEALFTAGQIAVPAGRLDEAEAAFVRAMAIGRRSFGDDALAMAALYGQYGQLLEVRGKFPEALAAIDRSIAIREKLEGRDHTDLVYSFVMRGRTLEDLQRPADAAVAYERAKEIAEHTLGDNHPSLGAILQDLGRLHGTLKKPALARAELDRALAIAKAGEEPAAIAAATIAIGEFLHASHQPRAALPFYTEALATYERLYGPEHARLIPALSNLGLAHVELHEPAAALPFATRAIAIEEKRSGATSPVLMEPLSLLATIQIALGRRADARQTLERAVALDHADADPGLLHEVQQKLARVR